MKKCNLMQFCNNTFKYSWLTPLASITSQKKKKKKKWPRLQSCSIKRWCNKSVNTHQVKASKTEFQAYFKLNKNRSSKLEYFYPIGIAFHHFSHTCDVVTCWLYTACSSCNNTSWLVNRLYPTSSTACTLIAALCWSVTTVKIMRPQMEQF